LETLLLIVKPWPLKLMPKKWDPSEPELGVMPPIKKLVSDLSFFSMGRILAPKTTNFLAF
jgi:hypothetical protein